MEGPPGRAALEYLAAAAHLDHQGWVAPVGLRDIATGIGAFKDTAASAVTAVRGSGLVTVKQPDRIDVRRRTGYRLHLGGIVLRARPEDQDNPLQTHTVRHPDTADGNGCPDYADSALAAGPPSVDPAALPSDDNRRRRATSPVQAVQSALFDPPTPEALMAARLSDPRSNLTVHAPTDPRRQHGHP